MNIKKFKKLQFIAAAIISTSLIFSGCSSTKNTSGSNLQNSKKSITVGFVPMTLNNQYFVTMVNGAKLEAKKQGVTLNVQAGQSHDSAEEQLQIVETMIQNKVDAICIVPSSSSSLMPALKKAQDAKIPIINLDTIFDSKLITSSGLKTVPFFGTDNYDGAKKAGEYALKLFADKKAKVAILTGIPGQQNTADRRNGFYDVVKNKFNIVAEQTANWDIEQGYNTAQNIIQAHPDVDLFFASNDEMALGAVRAAKAANKNIKVIGFDGSNEAVDSIAKGELTATVAQYPGEMGIQGVDAAVKAVKGESVVQKTNTGAKLITRTDVNEFKNYLKKFK